MEDGGGWGFTAGGEGVFAPMEYEWGNGGRRENTLSTSRETPASSVLHAIAANPPPPSSITPEPVPQHRHPMQPQLQHPQGLSSRSRGRAASTTPVPMCAVPEPLRPRRPAHHFCGSTVATVHRTGVVPAMSSFAASDLLPHRRQTATAPHSTTWPWVRPRLHRPPQLLVSDEQQEDRRKNRRRTQHCQ